MNGSCRNGLYPIIRRVRRPLVPVDAVRAESGVPDARRQAQPAETRLEQDNPGSTNNQETANAEHKTAENESEGA
jgi:hypothetical protein